MLDWMKHGARFLNAFERVLQALKSRLVWKGLTLLAIIVIIMTTIWYAVDNEVDVIVLAIFNLIAVCVLLIITLYLIHYDVKIERENKEGSVTLGTAQDLIR